MRLDMRRDMLAVAVFVTLEFVMALQADLAHLDRWLTVREMGARGVTHGMPFVWHLGMAGDVFIVSPVAAYVVANYWRQWSYLSVVKSLLIGLCATIVMHVIYLRSGIDGVHVVAHHLTSAGVVHFLFMVLVLVVFTLFYFYTPAVRLSVIVPISGLLMLHVFLGTHLALGLMKHFIRTPWYPPDPLRDASAWLTFLGVALIIMWRVGRVGRQSTESCEAM